MEVRRCRVWGLCFVFILLLQKYSDRLEICVICDFEDNRLESEEVLILRTLIDRGTEYCGKIESRDYEFYLAIEDIDLTKTKAKSPLEAL